MKCQQQTNKSIDKLQSKIDNRCRKEMKNMHHAISKSNKMHIKGEKKMMKKKKKKREKKIFKLR